MKTNRHMFIVVFAFFITFFVLQVTAQTASFDVLHYDAEITPNIQKKSVAGNVSIKFTVLKNGLKEITLNAGRLEIDYVTEGLAALQFEKKRSLLKIRLARVAKVNEIQTIKVGFHGEPRFGIRFFPEQNQVYTVFSTSQWMPCVDSPDDRATFRLKLVFPLDSLTAVGNGRLLSQKLRLVGNKQSEYVWEQKNPVSTYLFGFAAGKFRTKREGYKQTIFRYVVSSQFSESDIKRVFRDTGDMLDFYESKSGMKYPHRVYTQVLAVGNAQQEMSSFTVMSEKYGQGVLENEKAIWLGAHEFAHQWWGNMVTNRDWTHFWLNEGITNFMTAAYFEHRFGREEYISQIERYKKSYETIRDAGKDKPLVFPDWNKPTREDRGIVYNKGAYVVHLLRDELGEKLFWKGVKEYTRKHWGKSVTSKDFQKSMEKASRRDLSEFFNKWVYRNINQG